MNGKVLEIDRPCPTRLATQSGLPGSHSNTRRKRRSAGNETNQPHGNAFAVRPSSSFSAAIRFAPVTPRIEAIRREFIEIHEPATLEESHLVERLAIAQADLFDARAAWEDRVRWQKSNALELFDRSQRHRFETDLKAWNASPHGMSQVFGQTWHSAVFLNDLWHGVLEGLDTNFGLHFEQVRNMILALGGDWRVDRIDAVRGRVMCWFLALAPEAESLIRQWICVSRARRTGLAAPEVDKLRADRFLAAAPPAEIARENLRRVAEGQLAIWSAEIEKQRKSYFEERARCEHAIPAQPLGDPADVHETRRIRRELAEAETQFDKLERRLLSLRKARQNHERRNRPQAMPSVMHGLRIEPDQATTKDASNSRTSPAGASPEVVPRQLRACTVEPTPDSPQNSEDPDDSSEFDNRAITPGERAGGQAEQTVEPPRNRQARRPDAPQLAKAWRAKQKKSAKGRIGESTFEPPFESIAEEPPCTD